MDKSLFSEYMRFFLLENKNLNLISKNDEKYLWEKHIFDSLAIEKFFEKYEIKDFNNKNLLDIGTGGGFPAVPIAIKYPELNVTALDSIRKKISAVDKIKIKLNLKNLNTICDRVENLKKQKFDFVVTRAVAALKVLIPYAIPLLNKGGYFIAYKSIKLQEEIDDARTVMKKYAVNIKDILEYNLPLEDNYIRNLVIIKN